MKRAILIVLAVMLALVGCEAAMPEITEPDATVDTTVATDAPPTVDPTESEPAPTEVSPTETQAPTETEPPPTEPPPTEPLPTEPPVEEPRQEGLRLNEEQLEYFDSLFVVSTRPAENYYNLVLEQDFLSVQDIDLHAFFEDGSQADMGTEITQSECDYYNQSSINSRYTPHAVDRLSYGYITDVFQRYLGLYIPDMDMSTLVYNPATGYYYRAGTGTKKHARPDFTDGYYDEETGLVSLYFMSDYPTEEKIVTLRYRPEAEVTKFQIVSCIPVDYPEPRQEGAILGSQKLTGLEWLFSFSTYNPQNCYNLILNQDFASVQDIDLVAFFQDGSPKDMKEPITQSECDYYNKLCDTDLSPKDIDRLSYDFVNDVLQRYLGLTIPEMDMSTLVYNSETGYYYRANSGSYQHANPDFTDGYYNKETGLVILYYVGGYQKEERILTLRYKPEEVVTQYQIISCLPVDSTASTTD